MFANLQTNNSIHSSLENGLSSFRMDGEHLFLICELHFCLRFDEVASNLTSFPVHAITASKDNDQGQEQHVWRAPPHALFSVSTITQLKRICGPHLFKF